MSCIKYIHYTTADLKKRLYSPTSLYRPLIAFMLMETSELLRQKLVKSRTALSSEEEVADTAIDLWEQMAAQIISIIGEGGFDSLYRRSVFLTQSTYPWLAAVSLQSKIDLRFTDLKISFEGQTPEQASIANSHLLITFTDILASLIGEQLTIRLLRSAWGEDPSEKPGKELQNE